ncbi:MAG: preprotein translocase subunit SecA [Pseudomonadota bacterium]|nr:preprotein translocase subunit SecA [Pseudomonadota bacterium]MEC8103794.1 preprotein translocase subunit SecA [Pseudomonadota bacterium]MEE2749748.1 preprotein translocase subunit SecA [Pseudomonadota bacterium]
MIGNIFRKVFGSKNSRELKRMGKIVARINALEEEMKALSDEQLGAKTAEFREAFQKGKTLEALMPEAFAVCREASRRVMGMRHFDVQLIGGITLHEGRIAEMRTGEGKTLVATLPSYLNALTGKSVHVVTVNDYLARRDGDWNRPLFEFLGMTVGTVVPGMAPQDKKPQYECDIVYGTNNEFGFDYLRDNMAFSKEQKVQRDLAFAIVDEVDSILIDEARTPLIISGPADDHSELYRKINELIPQLRQGEASEDDSQPVDGHFFVDEKSRSIELTEEGHEYVEEMLTKAGVLEEGDSLYAAGNLTLLHHVHSALKAHAVFQKNVDYIVQNGQVVIVDEHTGRTMPGRRWSEGLHQAVEAKEGLKIQAESQTLASTTFQNFFRLYDKLAGMTGTADTEAFEFNQIYGLDVVVIPTNRPVQRIDYNDVIYATQREKHDAVVEEIREVTAQGRPVLVGTASIESSEYISGVLKKAKVAHNVLNAKENEREAQIIADAGRPGAVTIATNMAGRGTDIMLGGNWEAEVEALGNPDPVTVERIKSEWQERHDAVLESGGLHIIGTERHESRRIDNQLRGRAGRQGDKGSTRFFLSLEDSLMRIFMSDRMRNMMTALGMKDGESIEHRMVTNAVEKAQRKVEGRNFDIRKQLLEYDDVANDQRRVIYGQRNDLMEMGDISDVIANVREDVVNEAISDYIPPQSLAEQWDIEGLERQLSTQFAIELPVQQWLDEDSKLYEENLRERILKEITDAYQEKELSIGSETMRQVERQMMLQVLDNLWKEHLATMDHLRQGIHLRSYGQKNPKQEYKREAFGLFQELLGNIKHDTIRVLSHIRVRREEEIKEEEERRRLEAEAQLARAQFQHEEADSALGNEEAPVTEGEDQAKPFVRDGQKVGRNDPCPCGSGKKFKHCHGKIS